MKRFTLLRMLVAFVEAVIVSAALIYLAEYFDRPLVREAGGSPTKSAGAGPGMRPALHGTV
jgi:hypothetical protein